MTIQITFTTLTLSALLISGSWTLADDEPIAESLAEALRLEAEYRLPPGAKPPLPMEMIASLVAADPLWGLRAFEEETHPASTSHDPEETSSGTRDTAGYQFMDSEGQPLTLGEEEVLEFLKEARIVSRKRIKDGVNGVDKLLLERDGIRMFGAFRDVAIYKHKEKLADGTMVLHFRDDCRREVAAYRVSRLLGLDFLPPVVERKVGNRRGTLQLWVTGMTEKERIEKEMPRPTRWYNQRQTMYLFDNLIYNPDRHAGNMILGADGNLWAIDHTRSFWRRSQAVKLSDLRRCERTLWANLKALDKEETTEALQKILGPAEVKAFFHRHQMVVKHLQELIDTHGESAVLYGESVPKSKHGNPEPPVAQYHR